MTRAAESASESAWPADRSQESLASLHRVDDHLAERTANAVVEPAELRQIFGRLRPDLCDTDHRIVRNDVFERNISLACCVVARNGKLFEHTELTPAQPRIARDLQIEAALIRTVSFCIGKSAAFFDYPFKTSAFTQAPDQRVLQREQIANVVDEIVDLFHGEGARRPIADGLRFAQLHFGEVADQIEQRNRKAIAAKRCRELRIEYGGRQHLELICENLQVARQRMTDDGRPMQRVGSDSYPYSAALGSEETYWLGVYSARDALASALAEMVASNEVTEEKALKIAQGYLHDNALSLYPPAH